MSQDFVISGLGVVAPGSIGEKEFSRAIRDGVYCAGPLVGFDVSRFGVDLACEVKGFDAKAQLGPKGLRNLDRSALFLMTCAKQAIEQSRLEINDANTDALGVCTGTTFSHLWSIVEFDREVFSSGLEFSNPALFPSTVMNAASSHVSIRYNIQGFNTTVSSGYTSGLEALRYAMMALETDKAETVLCGGVDVLTFSLYFGFHKLGYMAGINGEAVSCPFDRRHNGPVLGEAAGMFTLERRQTAEKRKAPVLARVLSAAGYFDGFRMGKIHPRGLGLKNSVYMALDEAGVGLSDIDYVSSCANSSPELDRVETAVLKNVFGSRLAKVPVSSLKSMVGETFSAAHVLQVISCVIAMRDGFVPPTVNFKEPAPDCELDCVPNLSQNKKVKLCLATSSGPGGYNGACVLAQPN